MKRKINAYCIEKKRFFLYIFLLFLLSSCTNKFGKSFYKDYPAGSNVSESINVANLMTGLLEADKKLTPKIINNLDGSVVYRYTKRAGEGEVPLEEIRKRIELGGNFYNKDRENVKILLRKINNLKIKNKLDDISSGALGLWIPKRDLIIIDYRVINMGSQIFLEVLRHEAIHVAQSCFTNSRKNFPVRIGLPLEYSKEINLNLSHSIYSKNSKEVLNIEREAFTYSKIDGAAINLLNRFC